MQSSTRHLIAEGTFDPIKVLPKIYNGGMSRTNGMPLIIFLTDFTVLKFMYHFKSDYDLALERDDKKPAQWQGLNSVLIADSLSEMVPGHTGINRIFNSILCKNQTQSVCDILHKTENVPEFFLNYFEFCLDELKSGAAYDEFTVSQMEEYYGFLTNVYNIPSVIGVYKDIVLGTLFDVVWHYFKIKYHLPTFKHNDMHMENVMLFPIEKVNNIAYTKYVIDVDPNKAKKIGGTNKATKVGKADKEYAVYYVPYFGFEPRMIDFGLSEIPELGLFSVLDNVATRNTTLQTGIETKQLLRFIDFDIDVVLGLESGTASKYIENGLSYNSEIFDVYKSRGKDDPRETLVRAEFYWTK